MYSYQDRKPSGTLPDEKRIFCNKCKRETNHMMLCQNVVTLFLDDETAYWEEIVYRFWACAGCEDPTIEKCTTSSYETDRGGNNLYSFTFIPGRAQERVEPRRFFKLPPQLNMIYRETVEALNANLDILCAVGLRALIEGTCADKGIKDYTLEKKIDGLTNFLPANIVSSIHSFRFMGNDAAHDLTSPSRNDLRAALEVCEDILNFLYDLDYKAGRLPQATGKNKPAVT